MDYSSSHSRFGARGATLRRRCEPRAVAGRPIPEFRMKSRTVGTRRARRGQVGRDLVGEVRAARAPSAPRRWKRSGPSGPSRPIHEVHPPRRRAVRAQHKVRRRRRDQLRALDRRRRGGRVRARRWPLPRIHPGGLLGVLLLAAARQGVTAAGIRGRPPPCPARRSTRTGGTSTTAPTSRTPFWTRSASPS